MTVEGEQLLPVPPLAELRRRRSAKWRTYPPDVLPLFVAEMDFELAPVVGEALAEAVRNSDTGYALALPELGEALAGFAERRWGWQLDPAAVHPVTDVGVGVVELLRVLTRPGDRILFSPPVYAPFYHWVDEVRCQPVETPLRHTDQGWLLDLPALERAFAERPAAYLLCNPHNPVGRVHTPDELAELVELAVRYQVPVISDEIHAPLALPGARFTPLLSLPGAAEVAVSLQSASKAFNLAGLKCAAIVTGSARQAEVAAALPDDARWRIGHLGAIAATVAYRAGDAWLDQLLITLTDRRQLLGTLLAEQLPKLRWQPPEATYLAWLDCGALVEPAGRENGHPAKGADQPAESAQQRFLRHGVALEPGSNFGAIGANYVRLNFATSPEILTEAIRRMASAAG